MSLVQLCLTTTSFQFRNTHYQLTDSLPMGLPASPCIVNMFIARFEKNAMESFHSPPKLWLRYVGDIFFIPKKNVVGALLKHLNQQHHSIQFTLEEEKNQQLPFMDVRVH